MPYPTDPELAWPVATISVATAAGRKLPEGATVWLTLIGRDRSTRKLPLDGSTAAGGAPILQGGAAAVFRAAIRDIGTIVGAEVSIEGTQQLWCLDCLTVSCDKGVDCLTTKGHDHKTPMHSCFVLGCGSWTASRAPGTKEQVHPSVRMFSVLQPVALAKPLEMPCLSCNTLSL